MVYHTKKNGSVIKGLDINLLEIMLVVSKMNNGVKYIRIRQDHNISYYFLKIIEKRFG